LEVFESKIDLFPENEFSVHSQLATLFYVFWVWVNMSDFGNHFKISE